MTVLDDVRDPRWFVLRHPETAVGLIVSPGPDRAPTWKALVEALGRDAAWDMVSVHPRGLAALAILGETVLREQAETVLQQVREFTRSAEPFLAPWSHEQLSRGAWSIALEGDYEWPHHFTAWAAAGGATPAGVHLEVYTGWCLALYPVRED